MRFDYSYEICDFFTQLISFAPSKEMNQRKRVRKCQLQSKRAPQNYLKP